MKDGTKFNVRVRYIDGPEPQWFDIEGGKGVTEERAREIERKLLANPAFDQFEMKAVEEA